MAAAWLTTKEACRRLRVSVDQVYRLITSGKLLATTINRRLHVTVDSIAAYEQQRRQRGKRS